MTFIFNKQIKITTRDGELIEEIENNPYNLVFDFGKNEEFSDTQYFNFLNKEKLLELKEVVYNCQEWITKNLEIYPDSILNDEIWLRNLRDIIQERLFFSWDLENGKEKRIFYKKYAIGGPNCHLKGTNLLGIGSRNRIETKEFENMGKIIFYEEKEAIKCSSCKEQHNANYKGNDERENPFWVYPHENYDIKIKKTKGRFWLFLLDKEGKKKKAIYLMINKKPIYHFGRNKTINKVNDFSFNHGVRI